VTQIGKRKAGNDRQRQSKSLSPQSSKKEKDVDRRKTTTNQKRNIICLARRTSGNGITHGLDSGSSEGFRLRKKWAAQKGKGKGE